MFITEDNITDLQCAVVTQAKQDFLNWYGSVKTQDAINYEMLIYSISHKSFDKYLPSGVDREAVLKAWKEEADEKIFERIARERGLIK